ncbi:hypothetical protein HJC23_000639 [Cyclotella cryptica]|uniref:Uncharacterized protein n=1 Tax=Cyclotella cryptica TaxID=29204 RepID=A0ABD3Q878_9STRA|eukprot:CCRYP_008026-RA/>CCRYP_008026-RA protein AED:0.00 eAED:0.00 QI:251/1/1/1/0/0/2/88/441
MTRTFASILVVCTLHSQLVDAVLPQEPLKSLRYPARSLQTTKYCGADSLSAYLSCTTDTSCTDDGDCNDGETCWELNCPVLVEAQNEEETGGSVNDSGGTFNDAVSNTTKNVTTTTTATVVSSSTNATATTTTTSTVDTNSTSNETETSSISINPNANSTNSDGTMSPTITPVENWTDFDYTKFTKFCGPKHVGGYALAVSQCGPSTLCGITVWENHYGSSGNDCPHGSMCYSDITCGNGPGPQTTSTSSTVAETTTSVDMTTTVSENAGTSTMTTATISSTTFSGTTTLAPKSETSSATTTAIATNPILLTTRSSFCGSFYAEAVLNCGSKTMCTSSDDCPKDEECFEDISCTYDPNAQGSDDGNADQKQQVEEVGISRVDDDRFGYINQTDLSTTSDARGEGFSFAQNEGQNIDRNAASRIGIGMLSLLWLYGALLQGA